VSQRKKGVVKITTPSRIARESASKMKLSAKDKPAFGSWMVTSLTTFTEFMHKRIIKAKVVRDSNIRQVLIIERGDSEKPNRDLSGKKRRN
jgi:hypothetical protein